jgi:hypothetical protein
MGLRRGAGPAAVVVVRGGVAEIQRHADAPHAGFPQRARPRLIDQPAIGGDQGNVMLRDGADDLGGGREQGDDTHRGVAGVGLGQPDRPGARGSGASVRLA